MSKAGPAVTEEVAGRTHVKISRAVRLVLPLHHCNWSKQETVFGVCLPILLMQMQQRVHCGGAQGLVPLS